jgi:hypothetical protein
MREQLKPKVFESWPLGRMFGTKRGKEKAAEYCKLGSFVTYF